MAKFTKCIDVFRGQEEVPATISATIIIAERGRVFLTNFSSDYPLNPQEEFAAKEELIDFALAYPGAGIIDESLARL